MDITVQKIKEALSHVQDPDLGRDLISLGMIENIIIEGNKIKFDLVLTTPACPMKQKMKSDCEKAISDYMSPEVEVEVNFTAKIRQGESRDHESLKNVKNIIVVGSGKGGVGKSTVSANLALALAKTGAKVALVDADIYGPSVPMLFNLSDSRPSGIEQGDKTWIMPMEQYGIKIISIGFFVDPKKAILWRGPMASNALKQMFTETMWGEIDYMVVDLPPGTGDVQITLSQMLPVTAAILVSTPQQMALADVRKAADMFIEVKTPILGIVENMSYFTPAELPNNKYYIFGQGGCEALSKEIGSPLLAQIPLVEAVCEYADSGKPAVINESDENQKAVREVFTSLAGLVACEISKLKMS